MSNKSGRTPWEDTPYIDPQAAEQSALRAAMGRHVDPRSEPVKAWANKALRDEIDKLVNATTRNNQLFISSAALFEIVSAGALDEHQVTDALRDACRRNRLEDDNGERSVTATITSGRRHGIDNPRDLSHISKRNGHVLTDDHVAPITLETTMTLERGFWTTRESLQTIYLAALSRMCAPWAVLGLCAARALALVPPKCVLPPIIGGRGSLNWFCAIAAHSGGGKGAASAVSRYLIEDFVTVRNLGSGEGLVDSYKCKPGDDYPDGVKESVMFEADEIDAIMALSTRSGSTLMSTLRSAFSGETLGFSYRSNNFHLAAHTYRTTLVASVQPGRAGTLLDDEHGGTLQRFMWFPGTDSRITDQVPNMPGPLTTPKITSWLFERELKIPYEAVELIRDQRARINRGELKHLDGHALFIREKFAYALAVIDGRDEMNSEDWRLAGIASRVSDHTRTWVSQELELAQEAEHTKRGELQGVASAAADEKKTTITQERVRNIAKTLLKKIGEAGDAGAKRSDVYRATPYRDRNYFQDAFDLLKRSGYIHQDENSKIEIWMKVYDD